MEEKISKPSFFNTLILKQKNKENLKIIKIPFKDKKFIFIVKFQRIFLFPMRKFGIKLQNFSKTRFSSHFAFSENLFKSLKINDYLKSNLDRLGFIDMTTIQKKSLPLLIEKTNCLLLSETGTGKSLCYLIPILNEILNSKEQSQNVTPEENDLKINKRKGAIILSPTKELCTQIYSFARRMDKENRVNIMRAASLCYKSPIIKFTVIYSFFIFSLFLIISFFFHFFIVLMLKLERNG